MKSFKNILVVLSGSNSKDKILLGKAVHLAQINSAKLTCIEVIKNIPYDLKHLKLPFHFSEIQDAFIKERLLRLKKLVGSYEKEFAEIDAKVMSGTSFVEVIKEVVKEQRDFVITPAVIQTRVQEIFFGSTAMHLLRKCPCPVWIVRTVQENGYNGVLAAVNATATLFSDKYKMNKKIVELAALMATREQSELHIVNAWSLHGEHLLAHRSSVSSSDLLWMLKENEKQHREWLHEIIEDVKIDPDIMTHVHLIKGDVTKVVPKYVIDNEIETIVMGSGQTGIQGVFSSNTAEQMLSQVSCSVIAVKPDSYKSIAEIE